LIALGLVVVAMAAAGAGVKSRLRCLVHAAFIQMSDTFHQAIGEGGSTRSVKRWVHSDVRSITDFSLSIRGFFAAFGQNWEPMLYLCDRGYLPAVIFSIPAILVWLRWLERRELPP